MSRVICPSWRAPLVGPWHPGGGQGGRGAAARRRGNLTLAGHFTSIQCSEPAACSHFQQERFPFRRHFNPAAGKAGREPAPGGRFPSEEREAGSGAGLACLRVSRNPNSSCGTVLRACGVLVVNKMKCISEKKIYLYFRVRRIIISANKEETMVPAVSGRFCVLHPRGSQRGEGGGEPAPAGLVKQVGATKQRQGKGRGRAPGRGEDDWSEPCEALQVLRGAGGRGRGGGDAVGRSAFPCGLQPPPLNRQDKVCFRLSPGRDPSENLVDALHL